VLFSFSQLSLLGYWLVGWLIAIFQIRSLKLGIQSLKLGIRSEL
jgi:hypothetical protein